METTVSSSTKTLGKKKVPLLLAQAVLFRLLSLQDSMEIS